MEDDFPMKKSHDIKDLVREVFEDYRKRVIKMRPYWEHFEKKKEEYKVIRFSLVDMQKKSEEFLIVPRLLERFFLLYLNKFHPSQQNTQRALNIARVYSLLVHQHYKSVVKFNMYKSFFVSPSIWEKWMIGRKAKESSIEILKEMGIIIAYRFNRKKYVPPEYKRFVIMYNFNYKKVKWLYDCVSTLSILEGKNEFDEEPSLANYDDIMEFNSDFFNDWG